VKISPLSEQIPNFLIFFKTIKKQFTRVPFLVVFNTLTILMLGVLGIYAKLTRKGTGFDRLFSDPFNYGSPYEGILTGVSEVLWCVTVITCAFTFGVLRQKKARSRVEMFLLFSALLLGLLFIDDRFRITLILSSLGVSKKLIYLCYGSLIVIYGIKFWRLILATPYLPLIAAFILFSISRFEDVFTAKTIGMHAMLEDGTKLLALVNLALYFWHICHQEIWRNLQHSEENYQKLD